MQVLRSLNINNIKGKLPSRSSSSAGQNKEESRIIENSDQAVKQEVRYFKKNLDNKEIDNKQVSLNNYSK